jgi:Cu(I)/Ag(I) efflux system membrane fusion protein
MSRLRSALDKCCQAVGNKAGLLVVASVGLCLGYLFRAGCEPRRISAPASAGAEAEAVETATIWTCPMHPEVRRPRPGRCPKCGMELVDMAQGTEGGLRRLTVSEAAAALMDIETAPVERKLVTAIVRMVGKIDYDETRFSYITAWMPGRLDRLFVDYTGIPVRKGDHMVEIYSPELISAQEELLQAIETVKNLQGRQVGVVRETAEATVTAAREKLRLLGLTAEQVRAIEKRGKAADRITINAPAGGVVIHKHAQQGVYVKTGTRIYTIADLSRVWVKLDAYESDLAWLAPGQEVEFTTEAFPGRQFAGTIAFIDPVLTGKTRTVKVRVNAANPAGRLRPDMFVRAVVRAELDADGHVIGPSFAGKWICPMHPSVVRDVPGACDICGMALEPAESLGYQTIDPSRAEPPLAVPASAVLKTGTRAIVYVKVDPSLLHPGSVRSWEGLIAALRAAAAPPTGSRFLNARCPIQGARLDLADIPESLVRDYKGGKVGFCCTGCPEQWDRLSDAEREEKLSAVARITPGPRDRFRELLSEDLRQRLRATAAERGPPAALKRRLIAELNGILKRPDVYEPQAWTADKPSPEALGLLDRGPANLPLDRLTRLNRLLLEGAFPAVIAAAADGPTFEGREILLGPRATDSYIVRRGLREGQRVVVRGNFKIDSALQIQAKPSMMTPEGGLGSGLHEHARHRQARHATAAAGGAVGRLPARFASQLQAVLDAGDSAAKAASAAASLKHLPDARRRFAALDEALGAADEELLDAHALILWREYSMRLGNDAAEGKAARTLAELSRAAESLRANLTSLRQRWQPGGKAQPAATQPGAEDGSIRSYWTCPMHPEVRSDGPGDCPKCGMALIERREHGGRHE